jgi:hypothetical protein
VTERTDYKNQIREALPSVDKPKRTICEVHLEIYDRLDELGLEKDPVIALLEDAYLLGKKMDAKLRQYNLRKGDDWYAAEREKAMSETLLKRQEVRKRRQEERRAAERSAKCSE